MANEYNGQAVAKLDQANVFTEGQTAPGLTATAAQVTTVTDAGTTNQPVVATFIHGTSGVPAVGFGLTHLFASHSSTNAVQALAALVPFWVVATNATRKARLTIYVYDTAVREAIRFEADGSAAKIGLYGVVAVVRAAALTAANAGAINSGDATTDAVIANMRVRIAELETAIKNIGITL